jgi:hypothetical protein
MSIKEKIKSDLESIDNQYFLNQISIFISLFKNQTAKRKGNRNAILAFAGTLADVDAIEIQHDIEVEFSKIEGDW